MIVPEEVQRNEHRRQSLVLDRVARSSVIYTQPRQSVVSNMSGDSRTPTDVLLEMKNRRMTLGSDRRMSMRPRRKSVNPKIDPPPGMECLDGKRFTWMCKERFDILDGDGNVVALIKGPNCVCRCSTEASFKIYDKTGEDVIGSINKKWEGERDDNLNVDHEYFEIHSKGDDPSGLPEWNYKSGTDHIEEDICFSDYNNIFNLNKRWSELRKRVYLCLFILACFGYLAYHDFFQYPRIVNLGKAQINILNSTSFPLLLNALQNQYCIHPSLDPYHPSVVNFFHPVKKQKCQTEADWVSVSNGSAQIMSGATFKRGQIICRLVPILRGQTDDIIKYGKETKLSQNEKFLYLLIS
ncbi:unnamed protein product [Mytilus edulis]|uniref:Phospholipid scramblase n=1 Tax=Mytilus edulis TaxID=6550 RepID=A0A8S3VGA6_MYTED|nr:unnamed protein product [Mytilus edulis]